MWIEKMTLLGLALGFNVLTAKAALTSGFSRGINVVYDDVTNITWTSDANLLNTMEINLGNL